jgi:excisionase family DNA binding protein
MMNKRDPTALAYRTQYVAELLQVSTRHVQRLVKRGKIAGFRLGAVWRIPAAEIDKLLASAATTLNDK